jgi:ferredoxin
MNIPHEEEARTAARLKAALAPAPAFTAREVRSRFAARLSAVAAHPERVPIELAGRKLEARHGGTVLAAALKNGVRLMHVCGARTLCATCRFKVGSGAENLTPMRRLEKVSLRYHLSFDPRTRLACQARVLGPIEIEPMFPLCGDLPRD